jgi:putative ABC transport system substrate-binding protein
VIVANGIAPRVAKAATTTIPIVFQGGYDPVATGLVASLNRPGGNVTGVTVLSDFLGPKRLELLHEMVPAATDVGLLINPPSGINELQLRDLQAAAQTLGLQLHVVNASVQQDFDSAFATLVQRRVGALVISPHPFFTGKSELLAALTVRRALPAIYQWREFVAAGGLMSFGGNLADAWHLVGVYTGRILNGEKPADLPVQQATKFELIINLNTAKALGLTVPLTLRARANKVIE